MLSYALMTAALILTFLLAVCAGSVPVPLGDTVRALLCAALQRPMPEGVSGAIILSVRLPRACCAALVGAALSLCGAAMQGLLRNPLADGSTLGVSSGAALGAVIALSLGAFVPGMGTLGTTALAMIFAFLSLILILSLAYALDRSLATDSIILIGVIFSMFASSAMSLLIAFAEEKVRTITFWTMGSLSSSSMGQAGLLLAALCVCGAVILRHARELNAFAVGEDNARHIGVNVRRVKLTILIAVSALIGVCVSVGGTIGFVGLVVPHMVRMLAGPNHRRLLPASLFFGAVFLLLCDLASRMILRPVELPIGVITSMVGAAAFVAIFYRKRKAG